jgi:hypothetical protein
MSRPNGTSVPGYRVIYSEDVRAALQRLGTRAKELGLGPRFVAAIKALNQRLRTDPLDLGEPLRDHPNVGLQERAGNHSFLFARYAVDPVRYLVYVLRCEAIGHGF